MKLIDYGHDGVTPIVSQNLAKQIVVVNWRKLDRRFQQPRFQLFRPTGGTGCILSTGGGKVFGRHVFDGEDNEFRRDDFLGIATEELVALAMADTTPTTPIDLSLREYMLRARDGSESRGKTIEEARRRLSYLTNTPVREAWELHPDSYINPFGLIVYPEGAQPTQVKIKKGKEWTAAY
jgi:hypothetical protein